MTLSDVERNQLRATQKELASWVKQASFISARRQDQRVEADLAAHSLEGQTITVKQGGGASWEILLLPQGGSSDLNKLAAYTRQPTVGPSAQAWLQSLAGEVPRHLQSAKANFGLRRLFSGPSRRRQAERSGRFLLHYADAAAAAGVDGVLRKLEQAAAREPSVRPADALNPSVGLRERLFPFGPVSIHAASDLKSVPNSVRRIQSAASDEEKQQKELRNLADRVRSASVQAALAEMSVDQLRTATRQRLSIAPLKKAGIDTVGAMLANPRRVIVTPGIGEKTYPRLMGAARALEKETQKSTPVRIDVEEPTHDMRQLVQDLSTWEATQSLLGTPDDHALLERLLPLAHSRVPSASHFIVAGADWELLDRDVKRLVEWANALQAAEPSVADAWNDFLSRPAHYYSLLDKLGIITADAQAVEGELPEDVLEAVRELDLDTSLLKVSLRGYQDFAARFALVQQKVIIGDEMGLGKTVEALAVLAHLEAKQPMHALVICPASVVTNWVREIRDKSHLSAFRLHGMGRYQEFEFWQKQGGVAVTTFGMLQWVEPRVRSEVQLDAVVVDEAHYVKNPGALRSSRSKALIEQAEHAILMTGTPLENKVEEFKNLVEYVQPELVVRANDLQPKQFRVDVAPAYLRRNQEDVLTELPELVEVEDWLPLSRADSNAYSEAVRAGSFHQMRQVAMLQGQASTKIQRLTALAEEARENRRKVVVFSNYLKVLSATAEALEAEGEVFGPITGSVSAEKRQEIVDEFSAAPDGAVLISQVQAGGVGLNIQAASIVVIVEPQVKPTTEWQAIARAHRMGQVRNVQVHRLLSEESVDERMVQILSEKRRTFDDFAAISEMAERAPEAVDVSEGDLVRQVVEAEQRRLFSQENEDGAGERGSVELDPAELAETDS